MRDVRRIAAVAHGAGAIGTGAGRNDGGRSDFLGARTETVAWAPSCECTQNAEAEHGRCVVLDPFGGAGTTGLVADRLGRDAILIELNPRYAQMAKDRINGDAPLFAAVEDPSA